MVLNPLIRHGLVLCLMLSLSATAYAQTVVRIGVLAKRGAEHTLSRWQPTADYLSREIPDHKFSIVPLDFDKTNKLTNGDIDFILVNSAIYVELEMDYAVSRIATIINRNGGSGYTQFGGVLLTRADRGDIDNIGDMAGKKMAAVDEKSLGGFLAAWREMAQAGISPYKNTLLTFLGTHDAVVYAVQNGNADVGTVRTDTLERMHDEGKIDLAQFKVINPQHHKGFAYLCSTRLYPEWPLAKLQHTSEALSNTVVAALLRMDADNPAAGATNIAGWTVPGNYQSVHELLRELRCGPYADLGKITFEDLLIHYWKWLLLGTVLTVLISTVIYVSRLNLRLRETEQKLLEARDTLTQKVLERTKDLEESRQHLARISQDWNDAFDAIADPIFIHDRDMLIVRANPAYCKRAGHTLDTMIGQPYYQFFPKREEPLPSCLEIHECLQTEGNELQLASGEIFVSRSFSIFRADQSSQHAIHILEDVSEIRHAEARRLTLSRALEQSGEGAMILNEQRHILYCNPALRNLLHVPENTDCTPMDMITSSLVQKPFDQQLLQLFDMAERGENAAGEMELATSDAGAHPVFITVGCLRSESGDKDGFIVTVLDLSALKRAEEALTYRIGMESMIAGIASRLVNMDEQTIDHEINDALRQIGTFSVTDRAYLYHYDASNHTLSNSHGWHAALSTPPPELLQPLPLDHFPWLCKQLLANEEVIVVDINALPETAAMERQMFRAAGSTAILLVPLHYDGALAGLIGYDTMRKTRDWESADTYLLRLAGEIIINSLERVQAMSRLQRSEASLAAAQYIAHLGNWEWNIATNELYWSAEVYRIFGLTAHNDAISYATFLQAIHADDRHDVTDAINRALAGEQDYELDHRIIEPDGTQKIVHEIGQILANEGGEPVRMIGTVQDVTPLRQAEQEMKRLNRALRTLSKCNTTLVHARDEQTLMDDICRILIDIGGYMFAWVGYAQSDATQSIRPVAFCGSEHGFLDIVDLTWATDERGENPAGRAIRDQKTCLTRHIHTACDMLSSWRTAATTQGYQSVVALPLICDNHVFGAIVIDAAEQDAFDERELALLIEMAGDLAFGIHTLRGKAERQRAEQALRTSEQRYEELYENAPNGYLSIAAQDGSLLQFNQALCDMLGYDRATLSKKSIFDLSADTSHERNAQLSQYFFSGESIRDTELQLLHADGHAVWISATSEAIRDEHGVMSEIRASMTDISARKQAEAEQQRFAAQLQTSLLQAIRAIALTIEKRDPYTAGHQERVAELAVKIGSCMGLDPYRLEGLHLGALIHDIGKISVPAEILNRPGTLEPALFAILKAHPSIGYDIIKEIDFPWPLADMVLQHHEHLDGSGYPQGLKGDEISLESRILAVADVVEAMASHRPYRPARGQDMALHEIEQGMGTLYDPEVVKCCIKIFAEQGCPWSKSI